MSELYSKNPYFYRPWNDFRDYSRQTRETVFEFAYFPSSVQTVHDKNDVTHLRTHSWVVGEMGLYDVEELCQHIPRHIQRLLATISNLAPADNIQIIALTGDSDYHMPHAQNNTMLPVTVDVT